MKNPFASLNWSDFGKGLLILIVSTLLASVGTLFEQGNLTWVAFQPILQTTIAAALLYIVKNMFTNPLTLVKSSLGAISFTDILWALFLVIGSSLLSSLSDLS